jgi:hypothetical protein
MSSVKRCLWGAETVEISRVFAVGDRVVLDVPIRARFTQPDPRIDAVRGTVAVERGPLVYALESTDLGLDVSDVILPVGAALIDGGADDVRVAVRAASWPKPDGLPYRSDDGETAGADPAGGESRTVRLVPYASWGNRGPSTMRVFLPVE